MAKSTPADDLKERLDILVQRYNNPSFIALDPISIPHRFTKKQDIEISGLFSATLAWGQRSTILKNLNRLMEMMDDSPHDFIKNHKPKERKRFSGFVHRTFNDDDLIYFIAFLQSHYQNNDSMEILFSKNMQQHAPNCEIALLDFHRHFFSLPHLTRTEKHVSTPLRKSACKRLNLFLRWMVRSDEQKVDFGIWQKISPAQLLCPLDVHVHRTATQLGLIQRHQADWATTLQLTERLKMLDPLDPVKYDFALFGMSIENARK